MFKKNILSGALFFSALLSGAISLHAQTTLDVNQPDLLLCFEIEDQSSTATGGQENLEVDLGSLSSIEAAATANGGHTTFGTRLSVTDLTQTYGSNWNASNGGNGVYWSVFGAESSDNEVYTTDSVQPKSDTNSHLTDTNNAMAQVYSDMDGNESTANSNYAYVDTSDQSYSNSFYESIGGNDWGDTDNDVPGNVLKQTTSSTAFAFYDMQVQSSQGPAPEIGTFALSSAGVLTFTEVTAVPEPSTWAAILVGGACLVLYRPKRLRA